MKWNFENTKFVSKIAIILLVFMSLGIFVILKLNFIHESERRANLVTTTEVETKIKQEVSNLLNKKDYGKRKFNITLKEEERETLIRLGGVLYCKGLFKDCTNSKTPIPNLNNLDFYLGHNIYIKLISSLPPDDKNYMGDVETSIDVDVHYKNGKLKDVVLTDEREITRVIDENWNLYKNFYVNNGGSNYEKWKKRMMNYEKRNQKLKQNK